MNPLHNPIPASAPLLELRGINKAYAGGGVLAKLPGGRSGGGRGSVALGGGVRRGAAAVEALRGVSLTLKAEETLGLIGESGCGKSTLGYIVARVLTPDSGEIIWNGGPDPADAGRGVQIVFQDLGTSLNPAHRIGWMFREALRARGIKDRAEAERRVMEFLPRVGLAPHYLSRYQHELSGGQKQRVAIMLALLMEPRLIVADEIVSSLDVSVRAQVLNLLRELQALYGLSYLFISHEIDVVYYMSHTIAVMYRGEVVEEGSAEAVCNHALHPYTKLLLRESGMTAAEPGGGTAEDCRGHVGHGGGLAKCGGVQPEPARVHAPPPVVAARPGIGCGFYERCPNALPACALAHPNLTERTPGHRVRCAFL